MTQGWRRPLQVARPASRGLKTNCDKRFDARRRRSSADARPASAFRDAGLAKIMPGRNARFAGKDLQCQCASQASQLPWPVSPTGRPVPTSLGKQRRLRKSVVERFAALTRELREKNPVRLAYPVTCISLISP